MGLARAGPENTGAWGETITWGPFNVDIEIIFNICIRERLPINTENAEVRYTPFAKNDPRNASKIK